MKTVCIDAGHGGKDQGGKSLGTPEKDLALRYALRLGTYLRGAGVRVVYTRISDRFVELSERARIANEASADLFVSLHANASDNPRASGPWSIHAAGSKRGREVAVAMQHALTEVLGGNVAAVYPDASPWVGNRRLAVLRQTKMPAVLLELGFMTNPEDMAEIDGLRSEIAVCAALSRAIRVQVGAPAMPEPKAPEVAPTPAPDHTGSLVLDRIEVPTRRHVEEIVRVRKLAPDAAAPGLAVAEVLLRAASRGAEGAAREAVKRAADALADWIKDRAA